MPRAESPRVAKEQIADRITLHPLLHRYAPEKTKKAEELVR
jgi:hypothetical protein